MKELNNKKVLLMLTPIFPNGHFYIFNLATNVDTTIFFKYHPVLLSILSMLNIAFC